MAQRDLWVRVKSEDELRAGMAVQIRPCNFCRRVEVVFVREIVPAAPFTRLPDGRRVPAAGKVGLVLANPCPPRVAAARGPVDAAMGIQRGILYRLADDQLTDLSETRELETVR